MNGGGTRDADALARPPATCTDLFWWVASILVKFETRARQIDFRAGDSICAESELPKTTRRSGTA